MSFTALDAAEATVLTWARRHFKHLAALERDQATLEGALTVTPEMLGSALSLRVSLVVNAMRRARSSCFRYSNPDCRHCAQRLTHEERLFLQVFRACRQGRISAAHAHAMILCEGGESRGFLQYMGELARSTERAEAQQA